MLLKAGPKARPEASRVFAQAAPSIVSSPLNDHASPGAPAVERCASASSCQLPSTSVVTRRRPSFVVQSCRSPRSPSGIGRRNETSDSAAPRGRARKAARWKAPGRSGVPSTTCCSSKASRAGGELELMHRLAERRRDGRTKQRLIGVDPVTLPLERIGRQRDGGAIAGRVDVRSGALLDDGAGQLCRRSCLDPESVTRTVGSGTGEFGEGLRLRVECRAIVLRSARRAPPCRAPR